MNHKLTWADDLFIIKKACIESATFMPHISQQRSLSFRCAAPRSPRLVFHSLVGEKKGSAPHAEIEPGSMDLFHYAFPLHRLYSGWLVGWWYLRAYQTVWVIEWQSF